MYDIDVSSWVPGFQGFLWSTTVVGSGGCLLVLGQTSHPEKSHTRRLRAPSTFQILLICKLLVCNKLCGVELMVSPPAGLFINPNKLDAGGGGAQRQWHVEEKVLLTADWWKATLASCSGRLLNRSNCPGISLRMGPSSVLNIMERRVVQTHSTEEAIASLEYFRVWSFAFQIILPTLSRGRWSALYSTQRKFSMQLKQRCSRILKPIPLWLQLIAPLLSNFILGISSTSVS